MVSVMDIAAFLGKQATALPGAPAGALKAEVRGPAPLGDGDEGKLAFCGGAARDPGALLASSRAALVIVDEAVDVALESLPYLCIRAALRSCNARLDFIRAVARFYAPPRPTGIHPSAVVAETAVLGLDVHIGPGATVGPGVEIGDGTVVHAGVHLYEGVRVGGNVTIHAGAVIGADGFGYERDEDGRLVKFPQLGTVVIEDDVEIGANTCIDRAALGETRIRRGARIDNLVHVAHNTTIGQDAVVIALSMVGGGTRIGDGAWIAPSACLRNQIVIGENAVVGLGSVVTRDVPAGATVYGVPARRRDGN